MSVLTDQRPVVFSLGHDFEGWCALSADFRRKQTKQVVVFEGVKSKRTSEWEGKSIPLNRSMPTLASGPSNERLERWKKHPLCSLCFLTFSNLSPIKHYFVWVCRNEHSRVHDMRCISTKILLCIVSKSALDYGNKRTVVGARFLTGVILPFGLYNFVSDSTIKTSNFVDFLMTDVHMSCRRAIRCAKDSTSLILSRPPPLFLSILQPSFVIRWFSIEPVFHSVIHRQRTWRRHSRVATCVLLAWRPCLMIFHSI